MSFRAAYLLLGPAGLLEHHPGDVGSLRVGHGGFGQVALLEARLALTAQQSATESRPRRRSALVPVCPASSSSKHSPPAQQIGVQSLERMRSTLPLAMHDLSL